MEKSLDRKIARILADPSCRDFILADAKDADMAFGLAAPGRSPEYHAGEGRFRSLAEYRQLMREIVAQEQVDIMLTSASTSEMLTIEERLFDYSPVTPAVRANDTTDIWLAGGAGRYSGQPAAPFRSATLDHIQCGKAAVRAAGAPPGGRPGALLGHVQQRRGTGSADARGLSGIPHRGREQGLPAFPRGIRPERCGMPPPDLARFVNDSIVRTLAGVTSRGRPLFLKIVYHGPAAMEALAAYDRSLVIGILGGSAGTDLRCLSHALGGEEIRRRAALFGRKINQAEHQLSFVEHLRAVADDQLPPDEAVKAYHGVLGRLGIRPHRSLADDLVLTQAAPSRSGPPAGPKRSPRAGRQVRLPHPRRRHRSPPSPTSVR